MTDRDAVTGRYAGEDLLAWLREAALARHIHPATARSRRKAAEALFPYCRPDEIADLRRLNLQDLRARVADLPQGSLRPEVADLYLERLRSALRDYLAEASARQGESAKGPAVLTAGDGDATAERGTASGRGDGGGDSYGAAQASADVSALEAARLRLDQHRADIIPVPLGDDRVVFLQGIPADLTAAEARKIARVVEALGAPADDDG
jgi:hypothetical protein